MDCTAFYSVCFALIARGYIVEIRAVMQRSLRAAIRNSMDLPCGDLQYRDPSDEPEELAQGISYASCFGDVGAAPDPVFAVIQEAL